MAEEHRERQAKVQKVTKQREHTSSSDFVAHSLEDDPNIVRQETSSHIGHEGGNDDEGYGPAPPAPEQTIASAETSPAPEGRRQRAFEIRVGEDGELQMDVEDEPSTLEHATSADDEDSEATETQEMNAQGLEELLRNVASSSGAMEGDSSSSDNEDGPEPLPEDEMRRLMEEAEEDDDDSEDDISSSDSIPSPPNGGSTIYSEIPLVRPVAIYTGHRNVDTVKDVNFGGGDDSLIVSGSDDGNLFIWDKESTNTLIGIWKGDESVVNVMQWHPYLPVLAVSGIDNSVKVLAPTQGLLPDGQKKRWASRLDKKEEIEKKNADSTWSSQGLGIDPNVLLRLLARRQAQGDDEDDEQDDGEGGEGGTRRRTRRIPLQALLQLAHEGTDERGDCRIM